MRARPDAWWLMCECDDRAPDFSRRRLLTGAAVGTGLLATWRLGSTVASAPTDIGVQAGATDAAVRLDPPTYEPAPSSTVPRPEIELPVDGEILFPLLLEGDATCLVLNNFGDTRGRTDGYYHQGVDIMAPANTPQLAAADGTLTKWYEGRFHGWTLTGDDGVVYKYFHNTPDQNGWSAGDRVTIGDVIGFVGDTGTSAGNFHLHFEYRPDNVPADPYAAFQRVDGARFPS